MRKLTLWEVTYAVEHDDRLRHLLREIGWRVNATCRKGERDEHIGRHRAQSCSF